MIPTLQQALERRGYTSLTPVQEAVSDPELAGADLLVSAQTGSGKTVGFGLAIAPTILNEDGQFERAASPLAMVIAPTRELLGEEPRLSRLSLAHFELQPPKHVAGTLQAPALPVDSDCRPSSLFLMQAKLLKLLSECQAFGKSFDPMMKCLNQFFKLVCVGINMDIMCICWIWCA